MASIYVDQHCSLKELLDRATDEHGATLLIPDLQRPYIWNPLQVAWLIDSLIRGWPFGTFLTWSVAKDDPVLELARPFWKTVDRTDEDRSEQVSRKNPPGDFQMVLDGQQRIQSLLLAFGGDPWGFRLYDSEWTQLLSESGSSRKSKNKHWSLGCLCINLNKIDSQYREKKRIASLDYTSILEWVVTSKGAIGKSDPNSSALPSSDSQKGCYLRLSRLWVESPTMEIEQEQADDSASKLLEEHEVQPELAESLKRPLGTLLLSLSRLKSQRITYLELSRFDNKTFTRTDYDDAVVNIFTRLNTAGRVLTREDITFAWLKVGWDKTKTDGIGASSCISTLAEELKEAKLELSTENIVAGISFLYAAVHSEGKILSNGDLIQGSALKPMAADLSSNWSAIIESVLQVTEAIEYRSLSYRKHYQSLNSVFFLWAWYYIGKRWLAGQRLSEIPARNYAVKMETTLNEYLDRWLICSQWAGRWAKASAEIVTRYVTRLAECWKAIIGLCDYENAHATLAELLSSEVAALESDAVNTILTMQAPDRGNVRVYFTPLWIWHRLTTDRWKLSKVPLRINDRKVVKQDVDHTVSFSEWSNRLASSTSLTSIGEDNADQEVINLLGNCTLLEKNFNISKGKKPMKSFLMEISEFKDESILLDTWATTMLIPDIMMDASEATTVDIAEAIKKRDESIKAEIVEFIKGLKTRQDVE